MQTLDNFHSRETAPVHRIDVPNANGAHDTTDAVAEQTDRNGTEDDRDWIQCHAVEDVLSGENLATGSSNRCRSSRDSCDRMLLQAPVAMVEERDDPDVHRCLADSACGSPSSLELFAAGQHFSPGIAEKVGDEDNKGSLYRDDGGFELAASVRDIENGAKMAGNAPGRSGTPPLGTQTDRLPGTNF